MIYSFSYIFKCIVIYLRDDCLTINSIKDIKEGEEIFNTFGDMPNSRLLQMYGFTEENNPHDDLYIDAEVIKDFVRINLGLSVHDKNI